jgi:hypothetical protein
MATDKRLFVSIRELTGKDDPIFNGVIHIKSDSVDEDSLNAKLCQQLTHIFGGLPEGVEWLPLQPRDLPVTVPQHLPGYPVAVVVIRHLRMQKDGVDLFKPVVHHHQVIDSSMYPNGIGGRQAPELLMETIRTQIQRDVNAFQAQFVEFKSADFDIYFISEDDVRQSALHKVYTK